MVALRAFFIQDGLVSFCRRSIAHGPHTCCMTRMCHRRWQRVDGRCFSLGKAWIPASWLRGSNQWVCDPRNSGWQVFPVMPS